MATKKTTEEKAAVTEAKEETKQKDTVKIKLFRDEGKYKDPLFVGLNGTFYTVPRGVEVEVPVGVAKIIEQSMEAEEATYNLIESLSSD